MLQDQAIAANLAKRIRQAFLTAEENGAKMRARGPDDRPPSFAEALLSDPFEGERVSTLDLLPREWGIIVSALERFSVGAEQEVRR